MAKKQRVQGKADTRGQITPMVAATLTGVIYQARLLNRQAKLNIPETEVIFDVVNLWHTVMDALGRGSE